MVGKTLSHYEILESLGAGGMGEVYRARDTKLGRDVAIKVLPDDLAADPGRLARFEREAKLLASLSHANIGAIYGLEEAHDIRFLVLELIEGESLEQRLRKGAIPVPEALAIARQIAEALEAAHGDDIIHRDVKPANVLLTAKGGVKVLDFGIAKSTALDGATNAALTEQATSLTIDGTLMGTPPYMAPEQIRGEEADKRADIWAFGCVVYEMLAGKAAFARETVADTLVAVLEQEPDWAALPGATPGAVQLTLQRCLRKDAHLRTHDIADTRIELFEADHSPTTIAIVGREPLPAVWKLVLAVAMLWAVAATFLYTTLQPDRQAPGPPTHFTIDSPNDYLGQTDLSVSRDGLKIVYTQVGPEGSQLWLRRTDAESVEPIPGTAGAIFPFWSPDGNSLAFFQKRKLMRLDFPDRIRPIADTPTPRGGSWGSDDVIVFSPDASVLYRVPADGSTDPTPVTRLDPDNGENDHRFPVFLPDGRRFTYYANGSAARQIWMGSVDADTQVLVRAARSEGIVVPGFLFFVEGGVLAVEPVNPETLAATGEAFPLATSLWTGSPIGNAEVGVSHNGVLAYRRQPGRETTLQWFDRFGVMLESVGEVGDHVSLRLSPDASVVALGRSDPAGSFIYLLHLANGRYEQFVAGFQPSWLPSGDGILFVDAGEIKRKMLGTALGDDETVLEDVRTPLNPRSSLDGRFIVYSAFDPRTSHDIWILDTTTGIPEQLVADEGLQRFPVFSPDGEWVAYVSSHSGIDEVYVVSAADKVRIGPVSRAGGSGPRWSEDGRELFYVDPRGALMVVGVEGGEFQSPTQLFETRAGSFTVDGNGERFLMATPVGEIGRDKIHVITNWPGLLQRR